MLALGTRVRGTAGMKQEVSKLGKTEVGEGDLVGIEGKSPGLLPLGSEDPLGAHL